MTNFGPFSAESQRISESLEICGLFWGCFDRFETFKHQARLIWGPVRQIQNRGFSHLWQNVKNFQRDLPWDSSISFVGQQLPARLRAVVHVRCQTLKACLQAAWLLSQTYPHAHPRVPIGQTEERGQAQRLDINTHHNQCGLSEPAGVPPIITPIRQWRFRSDASVCPTYCASCCDGSFQQRRQWLCIRGI